MLLFEWQRETRQGIMKRGDYINFLDENLKETTEKLQLCHNWTYLHDNDAKHSAMLPSKSLDLNLIEYLLRDFKTRIPTNLTQLGVIAEKEWPNITLAACRKLVESYKIV
ncbi:unnamed protein product [Lepeophtheirus salmonis]|uniref:(salmon louse) hypothetical protein n=1 Tax=Lepeophtheirus salmonis TaxID=72036 RepID=A0A7R8CTA8_LEPSM|nr:unnamed protein product [Lepeophtheirus salmonis]CAF2888734.1 unnamed protein product [Lepeophtheirus salmonis]